jgi:protein gp37
MAQSTTIEWAEHVWNPISGCTRVSSGCDNCYAMHQAHRFSGVPGHPQEGLTVIRNGKVDWSGKIKLNENTLLAPLRRKKPTRYFVNSMSDLFHHGVPDEYIDQVFAVMALCPQHTFMILTKRPERMQEYLLAEKRSTIIGQYAFTNAARHDLGTMEKYRNGVQWPLPNVWLGVSVEDQKTADERIPILQQTPAAVRWISAEPLLGPLKPTYVNCLNCCTISNPILVNSGKDYGCGKCKAVVNRMGAGNRPGGFFDERKLDWVVVGGESGPDARPFNTQWARDIIKHCKDADVPVFFKQFGSHPMDVCYERFYEGYKRIRLNDRKGGDWSEWPEDLRVREYPGSEVAV